MKEMGVTSLKLVGRADAPGSVAEDIRITKEKQGRKRGLERI